MTLEEAARIATILGTVDGGCEVCVQNAVTLANSAFPGYTWSIAEPSAAALTPWPGYADEEPLYGLRVTVVDVMEGLPS